MKKKQVQDLTSKRIIYTREIKTKVNRRQNNYQIRKKLNKEIINKTGKWVELFGKKMNQKEKAETL